MNRKGFTLIELLAVIVLIALVFAVVFPSVSNLAKTSKEKSYDILIDNIKTASENYFMECENGNLKEKMNKIDSSACNVISNKLTIKIDNLVKAGLLTADSNGKVVDKKNDKELNECCIVITKNIETITDSNNIKNKKVTYNVTNSNNVNCKCDILWS